MFKKEKSSKNNSPTEIPDDFMDNAYEQISSDISKLLSEMEKEKEKGINNKDDLSQKFFGEDEQDKSIKYNNQMSNISIPNNNNNAIDIKMNNNNYYSNNNLMMENYSNNLLRNDFSNNLLMNNQAIRNNNSINTINNFDNNYSIINQNENNQINFFNNNSPPIYNFNIINNDNKNDNSIYNNNNDKNKLFLNQAITERGSTGLFNIDTSDNVININNIIKNKDKRTTLIIRNIPNRYTISLLLIELSTNFANKFDVLYLPQDKVNDCNLGYGFINFINPLHLILFYDEFMGKKWNFSNSQKRCYIAYSNSQGKNELINYMLKRLGLKKYQKNKLNEKIKSSFYLNDNINVKVPLEIPIKYKIKFESSHPNSLYFKKNDKIFIVETFEK